MQTWITTANHLDPAARPEHLSSSAASLMDTPSLVRELLDGYGADCYAKRIFITFSAAFKALLSLCF